MLVYKGVFIYHRTNYQHAVRMWEEAKRQGFHAALSHMSGGSVKVEVG